MNGLRLVRGLKGVLALSAMLSALALPALAQEALDADSIIRKLTPAQRPSATRGISIAPAPERKIIVEPGRENDVIAGKKGKPSLDFRIPFAYDSDELTADALAMLKGLGTALSDQRLGSFRFLIAGHTDAKGTDAYNDALSMRRARAVRSHLVTRFGLSENRLQIMGLGKRDLRDPSDPLSPVNRRVEIVTLD